MTIAPVQAGLGARGGSGKRAGWLERRVRAALARADIRVDGDRPWDMRVHDRRIFRSLAMRGMTGAGESYVEGWWDSPAVDELFTRAARANLGEFVRWTPHAVGTVLRQRVFNLQSKRRAARDVRSHYDLGNDLFEKMLDRRMAYSCGYWAGGAATLDEAQEAKLDLVWRKLGMQVGQRVLDIGCGWGSFVQFAGERGAACAGITLSPEQARLARARCAGLPVDIDVRDYREIEGKFDRVVSIGMFEHVGQRNHRTYMKAVRRALRPGGVALIHFFASPRTQPNLVDGEPDWFERNIFPGMLIPSLAQVGRAIDGLFVVEDLHNVGADYDPTLIAWWRNFERCWPELAASGRYDERFYRMWKFYLLGAAGAFRSRKYQVWQVVLAPEGATGGYRSVR